MALAAPEVAVAVPWLLLGLRLEVDGLARVLLALTAAVWLAAAVAAPALLGAAARRAHFAGPFLAAMGGNVLVLLAADVVTLYAGFALVTYASYGLVAHDATPTARRAARIYAVYAVAGEALLLAGLLLAVAGSGGLAVAEVARGVAQAPGGPAAVVLLLAGFGVKAGMIGLHGWLALAHPAAPVPASAVLSGCIIKVGVLGWLRLLPLGEAVLPVLGVACVTLGLLGAFVAALLGVLQDEPKTVLAYSSVSQMGLVLLLVGTALAVPGVAASALAGAALFALHHGFAKATLFLGVGLVHAEVRRGWRRLVLAGQALAALALAGAPLTSGMVAKAVLKDVGGALWQPWGWLVEALLVPLTGTATMLVLGRLLWLLAAEAAARVDDPNARRPAAPAALLGWSAALAAALGATWVGATRLPAVARVGAFDAAVWWDGVWPLALGGALLAAMARRDRLPLVPPGDAVVLAERAWRRLRGVWPAPGALRDRVSGPLRRRLATPARSRCTPSKPGSGGSPAGADRAWRVPRCWWCSP